MMYSVFTDGLSSTNVWIGMWSDVPICWMVTILVSCWQSSSCITCKHIQFSDTIVCPEFIHSWYIVATLVQNKSSVVITSNHIHVPWLSQLHYLLITSCIHHLAELISASGEGGKKTMQCITDANSFDIICHHHRHFSSLS